MISRNSVILDAAEAAVLLRDPLGLLLLRPCPSQPFSVSDSAWHVQYSGQGSDGYGVYETEADMLHEYRPAMLRRHSPCGAVLDVREPWQYSAFNENGYCYASRNDVAGRWNSPALMPRAAVQMRARVADVRVVRLKDIPDWDLDALLGERGRRGWKPPWWDSRSFAREGRGTLEHQNPYIYATRLKRQEMP